MIKSVGGVPVLPRHRLAERVAKHYCCGTCGIYTHHQRRSNPNQYGYNVGCLEDIDPFMLENVPVVDGVNHPSDRVPAKQAP